MHSLPQKLVAEFIGTFTLIYISAGSICADQYLTSTGQSGLGLLGIATASGLALRHHGHCPRAHFRRPS